MGLCEYFSCACVPCMSVIIYDSKSTCTQCGGGEPGARKAHKMLLGERAMVEAVG